MVPGPVVMQNRWIMYILKKKKKVKRQQGGVLVKVVAVSEKPAVLPAMFQWAARSDRISRLQSRRHPDPMQWTMDGAVNAHLFPDVSSFGLAMRLENEGCEQTKVNTHTHTATASEKFSLESLRFDVSLVITASRRKEHSSWSSL